MLQKAWDWEDDDNVTYNKLVSRLFRSHTRKTDTQVWTEIVSLLKLFVVKIFDVIRGDLLSIEFFEMGKVEVSGEASS